MLQRSARRRAGQPVNAAAPRSSVAAARAETLSATSNEAMPTISGIGVLLVNLGTPDAAEPKAVRRYLKEFLSDRRVIENDTLLWKFVLNGIILPLRSRRKARDYEKIWNPGKDKSPLKTTTRSQAEKLAGILEPLGKHMIVDWAMRYASPRLFRGSKRSSRAAATASSSCRFIRNMPRPPPRRSATSVPLFAAAAAAAGDTDHAGLLRRSLLHEVLSSSLKAELKALPFSPDVIVASYHGMPQEYVQKGDPYERQCVRTTELLRQQLKLDDTKLI